MTAREEARGVWLAPDWSGMAIEDEDGSLIELGREHGYGAWVSQGMLDVVPDHWVRLVPMPDDEPPPAGQSPWDAYVAAYREYQETDPHGAEAHPTAHHMHALEAALRVADAPAPRVFLPDDQVPVGTVLMSKDGSPFRVPDVHTSEGMARVGVPFVEVHVPSPEEWQAAVDRARDEREAHS